MTENEKIIHTENNIADFDSLQHELIGSARQNLTEGQEHRPNPVTSSPIDNFKKVNKLFCYQKSSLQSQMYEVESKLFHQIILKSQLSEQSQFQRNLLKKLSQSVQTNLQQVLLQISKTYQKMNNPLLNHFQKQQIKQKLLELRMQQLADTRVLVNTYRHHQYRLVISLVHMALVYQELDCHQQAIGHLENALQISQNFRSSTQDALYYHSLMLSYLALSQNQMEWNYKALENLNQSVQFHQHLKTQNYPVHDFFTLQLITRVLASTQKYQEAISFGKMTIQSAKNDHGVQSLQYATACKTLAEVQVLVNDHQQAIDLIKKGIRVLQVNLPEKQEKIIEFYTKLAQIILKKLNSEHCLQRSQNHFEPYIEILQKKYEVLQNSYGYRDKRVIKEKRHLASSYLKYGKTKQAEEQLQDILEIQQIVYGEKSVEVAKTLKMLGSVAMSHNENAKAQKYLKKSQGIFHDQGQLNLQKQVQAKLLILTGKGKFLTNTKA